MTIRTNLKSGAFQRGGGWANHNEAMRVRSTVKAGGSTMPNHNEALRVRSELKAGKPRR